ncbi:hypothetical protein E8E12_004610 [Didymella heteroderae]|uniref:Uncharacterized protein n=1 Tax=Didymella heteroderae TaxID=1769908 RepID=A0A9P4WMI9_9PLEO|nr:hypothetical protein E8E12_004610 [Didymella heteroderae]
MTKYDLSTCAGFRLAMKNTSSPPHQKKHRDFYHIGNGTRHLYDGQLGGFEAWHGKIMGYEPKVGFREEFIRDGNQFAARMTSIMGLSVQETLDECFFCAVLDGKSWRLPRRRKEQPGAQLEGTRYMGLMERW